MADSMHGSTADCPDVSTKPSSSSDSPIRNDDGSKQQRSSGSTRGKAKTQSKRGRGFKGFGAKSQRLQNEQEEMDRSHRCNAPGDKRKRVREDRDSIDQRSKRQYQDNDEARVLPAYATKFSAEEIAAQERQPKRKVAVLIGYAGSGYKGMQLNHQERTIEGDLFAAFVKAGAISKANADDPRKSSLVRCARTDKGVHASGNVISLKLVVSQPDIVQKINDNLNPQIRVWAISRTNNGFSAYQACDSRIYEYLMPSYCFLPPHPKSFLGQQLRDLAIESDDLQQYEERQQEVKDFWPSIEKIYLESIISTIDPSIRDDVLRKFYSQDDWQGQTRCKPSIVEDDIGDRDASDSTNHLEKDRETEGDESHASEVKNGSTSEIELDQEQETQSQPTPEDEKISEKPTPTPEPKMLTPSEQALRNLKAAAAKGKRAYRIAPARLERIQAALSHFIGTRRYHNYTVDKQAQDPSAMRVIKSFRVSEQPLLINGTEWLSLKVLGQSFMMHQIRKMVSAATLVVRCGCPLDRLDETYLTEKLTIPKAPSLGLLLERPIFDAYNARLTDLGREMIDFTKYDDAMQAFKQTQIYERIYRDEERDGVFLSFFSGLDVTRDNSLLWLSSMGRKALGRSLGTDKGTDKPSMTEATALKVNRVP